MFGDYPRIDAVELCGRCLLPQGRPHRRTRGRFESRADKEAGVIATSIQTKPRPVFCVIEHLHRDLALAEQTCLGQFTHAGITLALSTTPDWLASAFPGDTEWRIEWSKFYYGLDLAAAFH